MEDMLGEIKLFAGTFAPRGWAYCHGQKLSLAQNPSLYSLLGTTYGGDGRETFALPDLRGRTPVGVGNAEGLQEIRLAQRFGVESVELNVNQLPAHSHGTSVSVNANSNDGDESDPSDGYWSSVSIDTPYSIDKDVTMAGSAVEVTVESAGNGQKHENRPPSLGLNYIICVNGLFPNQN